MSEISHFDRVRVGSGFPSCADVVPLRGHESYGLVISTWLYRVSTEPRDTHRVEFRLRKNEAAMILYRWDDQKVPDGWEDSELIWESHPRGETA